MKKAFTMIELVFVIVVIGILAAVIIPNTRTNPLYEAATQLVSHIRYTQHLAMVDDKFDSTDSYWYKGRWQIIFTDSKTKYSIYSDGSSGASYDGNSNIGEMAVDPSNKSKVLSPGSNGYTADSRANNKLDLKNSYGIDTVTMTGGCSGDSRISFDHLGRPISGTIDGTTTSYVAGKLLISTCNIVLVNLDENVTISIEPETGYAHILQL